MWNINYSFYVTISPPIANKVEPDFVCFFIYLLLQESDNNKGNPIVSWVAFCLYGY